MLRTQLANGGLVSLRQGVFIAATAVPQDKRERHVLAARAEQAVNPTGVISHQSAALVWRIPFPGFGDWTQLPPALTVPIDHHRSRSDRAEFHRGRLAPSEITSTAEGAVTSPARTAIDLAADRDLPEALVILDAAARRIVESFFARPRRVDYSNPRLVEAARGLLRASAAARRITRLNAAISSTEPCRESAAESLSAGHIHLAGLPVPSFQDKLVTPLGTFYPDCLWREHGLIGECDGTVKYTDAAAFAKEKTREQALRDLGFDFVRWQAKEIMLRPDVVIDRIARSLAL